MSKLIIFLLILLLAFPAHSGFDTDGSEYIDLNDVATLDFGRFNDFSICFWLYMRSREFDALVTKQIITGNFTGWGIFTDFTNNEEIQFQLRADNSPLNSFSIITDDDPIPLNEWIHVCATYNGSGVSGMEIYVNAVVRSHIDAENAGSASIDNTASVNIGARADGNRPPNAVIQNVCFYDDELTAEEVSRIYNGHQRICLQVNNDQLVGFYPLDECPTGENCNNVTFKDLSVSGNDGTGVNGTGAPSQVRSYP